MVVLLIVENIKDFLYEEMKEKFYKRINDKSIDHIN